MQWLTQWWYARCERDMYICNIQRYTVQYHSILLPLKAGS